MSEEWDGESRIWTPPSAYSTMETGIKDHPRDEPMHLEHITRKFYRDKHEADQMAAARAPFIDEFMQGHVMGHYVNNLFTLKKIMFVCFHMDTLSWTLHCGLFGCCGRPRKVEQDYYSQTEERIKQVTRWKKVQWHE